MKDLYLNTANHDLEVTNFDLSLVNEADWIAQKVKIKLLFFLGEWFLDTSKGIPFYKDIFVKNPNLPNIENILKIAIIEVNGVNKLISFESDYVTSTRKFVVAFTVNTDYGDLELTEEL